MFAREKVNVEQLNCGRDVAYYDTGCDTDESSMRRPAVASLLVGMNCGTDLDTRLFYAAAPSWKRNAAYYAIDLIRMQSSNQYIRTRPQTNSDAQTIVRGVGVGDDTFDMSRDDVLKEMKASCSKFTNRIERS